MALRLGLELVMTFAGALRYSAVKLFLVDAVRSCY